MILNVFLLPLQCLWTVPSRTPYWSARALVGTCTDRLVSRVLHKLAVVQAHALHIWDWQRNNTWEQSSYPWTLPLGTALGEWAHPYPLYPAVYILRPAGWWLADCHSCLCLLASVSKWAACASEHTISPVKYCDCLGNARCGVGNPGGAELADYHCTARGDWESLTCTKG